MMGSSLSLLMANHATGGWSVMVAVDSALVLTISKKLV